MQGQKTSSNNKTHHHVVVSKGLCRSKAKTMTARGTLENHPRDREMFNSSPLRP